MIHKPHKVAYRLPAICLIAILMTLSLAARAQSAVRFVRSTATGANDGTSWFDAHTDLQSALSAASPGDEIWIAKGKYTPPNAASSFILKSGAGVYGGFAGTENSLNERNVAANWTILSGDVGADDNPNAIPGWAGTARWYNGWNWGTANVAHVVMATGLPASSVLDGVTIEAGFGGPGAGIAIDGGSPIVRNCTFIHNFGPGGAIRCSNAMATIDRCTFIENAAGLASGGAISVYDAPMPTITFCTFVRCMAYGDFSWDGNGGAIEVRTYADTPYPHIAIRDCVFEGNRTKNFFSASSSEVRSGAGIFCFGAILNLERCSFIDNASNYGGAVTSWNAVNATNCVFHRNDSTQQPVSGEVSHGGMGAGICLLNSFTTEVSNIINCNFSGDTADESVGIYAFSPADVHNCILWGEVSRGQEVAARDVPLGGNCSIQYSCVQDLLTPEPDEDPPNPADYPGCIVVDPHFVNAPTGEFHLADTSPCIDAGRNSYVPAGMTTDLDGRPRFFDDLATPDTGLGSPPLVDMGAFEFSPIIVGDVNCDGQISLADAQTLAEVLIGADTFPCHVSAADLDASDNNDGADIQTMVEILLNA